MKRIRDFPLHSVIFYLKPLYLLYYSFPLAFSIGAVVVGVVKSDGYGATLGAAKYFSYRAVWQGY